MLFGGYVLCFWQHFAIGRIIIGMEDGVFVPRDMRHQLAERFGRAITNSRGNLSSGAAINSQPQESLVGFFLT